MDIIKNDTSQSHQSAAAPAPAQTAGAAPAATVEEHPQKSYLLTLFLSLSFGWMGIDRLYLNKTGTAVAKLLTLGGLGIWAMVDLLMTAFGAAHAKDDDRPLKGYAENRDWVKKAVIFFVIFWGLYIVFIIVTMVATTTFSGVQDVTKDTDGIDRGTYERFEQPEGWPGQSTDYQLQ